MNADKGINVDDINESLKRFGLADYVLFVFMLMICSVVGICFGYTDHRKQQKINGNLNGASKVLVYLVSGRNMQIIKISLEVSDLYGIFSIRADKRFTKET